MLRLLYVTCFILSFCIFGEASDLVKHQTNEHALQIGAAPVTLRVMTFNLWNSGTNVKDGLKKIAKHILEINPDVVALEEVETTQVLTNLTTLLGAGWVGKCNDQNYPDTGIVTRHQFLTTNDSTATFLWNNGATRAKIQMVAPGGSFIVINFWAFHLAWQTYGPYVACNRGVTDSIHIEAAEACLGVSTPGRIQNAYHISMDPFFQADLANTDQEPMFVAGDFNCPSHLDWVESTKDIHCGWVFQWPATKIMYMAGMTDAFRTVNPDPAALPGNTWSTVTPYSDGWRGMIPEPQDRIDMIMFKSTQWIPVDAQVYHGTEPITPKPYYYLNDWPSDHASVYADFQLKH